MLPVPRGSLRAPRPGTPVLRGRGSCGRLSLSVLFANWYPGDTPRLAGTGPAHPAVSPLSCPLWRNLEAPLPHPLIDCTSPGLQQPGGAQPGPSPPESFPTACPLFTATQGLLSPRCHCRLGIALSSCPPSLRKDLITGLFSLLDKIPERGDERVPMSPSCPVAGRGVCEPELSGERTLQALAWAPRDGRGTVMRSPRLPPLARPAQRPQDGNSFQTT